VRIVKVAGLDGKAKKRCSRKRRTTSSPRISCLANLEPAPRNGPPEG
jgi:hypothetical protein